MEVPRVIRETVIIRRLEDRLLAEVPGRRFTKCGGMTISVITEDPWVNRCAGVTARFDHRVLLGEERCFA